MGDELKIEKEAYNVASGMIHIMTGDLRHIEEGEDEAKLSGLGYEVIFTTRDLMFAPMVISIFEMMGQNGIKNLFYRGGSYAGERFALETVEGGLAKWDESLLRYNETIGLATGWGYLFHPEINLDIENPRVVCQWRNHPSATTVPEIMKSVAEKNPSLSVDFTQTFCDYHTGWLLTIVKLILKNNGAKDEVISKLKGREEYCQAQEGRNHCRHVIGLLD